MDAGAYEVTVCSNCGATITFPKGISAVKCPFCGYTLVLFNQLVFGFPVYMMPIKVKRGQASDILLGELAKKEAVSEGFENVVAKADVKTVLIPFIIYNSESTATYEFFGQQGDAKYMGEIAVPLNGWFTWLSGISVPPASRVPLDLNALRNLVLIPMKFDHRTFSISDDYYNDLSRLLPEKNVVERGGGNCEGTNRYAMKLLNGERFRDECYNPRVEAERVVERKIKETLVVRGLAAVKVDIDYRLTPVAIVYVPFHFLSYRGKYEHYAVINASTGEVLWASYEEGDEFVKKASLLGGAVLLSGIVSYPFVGLYGPLVGVVSSIPYFYMALKRFRTLGTMAQHIKKEDVKAAVVRYIEGR